MSKTTKCLLLLLFALLSGTATLPLHAQPSKTTKSKSVLKSAKDHLKFEEFQQAIPYIEQLLEQEPGNAYYNFWMGKCLYLNYKKNQALKHFEVVNRVDPAVDKEFHYYYALTLHYNLKFDLAIEEYRLALNNYEAGSEDFNWVNNRIAQCIYAKKLITRKEGDQVKITNVGDKINTEYAEHSPVISANDSVLIFTARRPDCLGAQPDVFFYDEDLYISTKKNGKWSEAENIATPVNSKGHDATIALNAKGTTLFIYRHKKDGGLYVTDFDQANQEWREPKKVEKPLNSKYYEASICISADSTKMFFTSNRPGGYGGLDIYMVAKTGEKWGDPTNMGPIVNTAANEDAPFFHSDGKTLYYSSDGQKSMGGYDIYVTEWDSVKSAWLEPLNMGYPVNTPDDDIYFVLSNSGKFGYYSSGKEGGFGEKDIYQIEFPYYPYPRRYFIVDLVGTIKDSLTDTDMPSMVYLVDKDSQERLDSMVTDVENKSFYFILEPGKTYDVVVNSDGFDAVSETVTAPVPVDEDLTVEKPLRVKRMPKPVVVEETPVVVPKKVEIQHIYYDFDKYDLRQESRQELDIIADFLRNNPDMVVNLRAHTDWFGTYDYNVNLSLNRSNAAYNYLLSKGISPTQMRKSHYSETSPIETNENDEGRQYNRRVEFVLEQSGKTVLTSVKLRTGVEGVLVDHTKPKGLPGFDGPSDGAQASPLSNTEDFQNSWNGGGTGNPDPLPSGPTGVKGSGNPPSGPTGVKGSGDPVTGPTGIKSSEVKAPDAVVALVGLELHNIYFDFDKSIIRNEARNELDKVATLLQNDPLLTLEIGGHTDSFGNNDYNQLLSERRCQAALDYLLAKGLTSEQAKMAGFSENIPLDTNDSDAGRQMNRRVEFRVLKAGKPVYISIP